MVCRIRNDVQEPGTRNIGTVTTLRGMRGFWNLGRENSVEWVVLKDVVTFYQATQSALDEFSGWDTRT